MSQKMLPEKVTDVMKQCFKMMSACIECYGGKIDKFIGDCVMVVFGVPESFEKTPMMEINSIHAYEINISHSA